MEEFVKIAERLGVSVAVLAVILGIAGWCAKRLFQKDDGILTMVAAKHIELMDNVKDSMNKQADATESLAESSQANTVVLTNLCDQHKARKSPFATQGLVAAAEIAIEIALEDKPEHAQRLEAMRRELTKE